MSQSSARGGLGFTGAAGPPGPPGTSSSGIALFQLSPITSQTFLGRYSPASGIPQEMAGATAVGLLPAFTTAAAGLAPAASGGAIGNFLRDDGTWQAAGAAGRPSGVLLGEQAVAAPFTLQGRNAVSTGVRQDLTPGAVGSMIGGAWGSGLQLLAAPTGGVQGRMLRDDGQWIQPSFVASGIGLPQLGALSPLVLLGRNTVGSGAVEQLSPGTVGSMIGQFVGSGAGLVPTPTGGALGRVLNDDGTWKLIPSGGVQPSGISLTQLADISSPRIIGRFSAGSGVREQLTGAQVASMIPWSSFSAAGLVPKPSGATASGMFLRDDGVFASPTGLGNGQFALMPPGTIKGTPGATGLPQDLVGSGVATLLPVFNNVDKGLVPAGAGGSTANFLRADGQWAAPSTGGAVSGVAFSQLQDISPFTILGRTNGSGTTQQLSPLAVASLLPLYQGSGFGLVPVATGGQARTFLRDDGAWQIPLASGIANAALAPVSAPMFKGRITAGSGVPEDLSPGQAASLLPAFFASGARGIVMGPTGGAANNFLRDDGSWAGVPSSVPTGLTLAQRESSPPFSFNGRFSLGTGVTEYVSNYQAASMLPLFSQSGTSKGVVMGPSAVTGNFLRDDGSWQAVSAGGGGGPTMLAGGPQGAIQYNGGSGLVGTGAFSLQNAALNLGPGVRLGMPQLSFSGATDKLGAVTPSGFQNIATGISVMASGTQLLFGPTGGGGPMITASGFAFNDIFGVGNAQLRLMPPSTIKGNTGATGAPQDLVGSGVATLLPVFNAVDKGLVPGSSNNSTTNFLRGDGAWAAPSVAGGVSGVAFNQIQDVAPFTFLGKSSNASGTTEQMSPLSAASLLPLFRGSGMGMVPAPTGGSSGFFLRDDGKWFPLLRNEVVGPATTGFGTAAGSATIDFTAGEHHERDLGGPTKFYLTPPSLMRHVQIRFKNLGSGYNPTFFGTAVKFAGGSGAAPSLFSRASGGLSVANFFWDGSLFHGTVGADFV